MKINLIFRSLFLFFAIFLSTTFIVPSAYGQGTPVPIVYSDKAPPESFEKYNPITYVTKDNDYRPPVLIARAGRDYLPQINLDANEFVSRMRTLNGDVKRLIHPSGRHGFDYLNNDDQSRHIIKETIVFLKSHLNKQ